MFLVGCGRLGRGAWKGSAARIVAHRRFGVTGQGVPNGCKSAAGVGFARKDSAPGAVSHRQENGAIGAGGDSQITSSLGHDTRDVETQEPTDTSWYGPHMVLRVSYGATSVQMSCAMTSRIREALL